MAQHSGSAHLEPPDGSPEERLDSWKEIAAYLKRDVRTVQPWEKSEGLPVRRHVHAKLGTVYPYKSELDAWWNNRRPRLEEGAQKLGPIPPKLPSHLLKLFPHPWTGIVVGLGIVLTFGVVLVWRQFSARSPGSTAPIRAVVVLPMENLSGDAEEDYLADGITEALITELGRLGDMRVVSRTTSMRYK